MSRRLTFRGIPPQEFEHPTAPEVYDVGPLLVFVVRGVDEPRKAYDTLEALSVEIGRAFPDRRAVVMVLAPEQTFEVHEETDAP